MVKIRITCKVIKFPFFKFLLWYMYIIKFMHYLTCVYKKVSGEEEYVFNLYFSVRIYADIQVSRSLRRVGMPCRYVVPRLEHYGMKPEPDQELISVTFPDLPINYHLEHLEPVVPRVRLFSVMVPQPANTQIAK